jgi:hypothetical protein
MEFIFLFLNVTGILMLFTVAGSLRVAWSGLTSREAPRRILAMGRWLVIAQWLLALILAPLVGGGDWVHTYWAFQMPLLWLFVGAGFLGRDRFSSWVFFAVTGSLALHPLLLVTFLPETFPNPREIGAPALALWEFACWGFGGELPAHLEASAPLAVEQRWGWLPRVMTLTVGPTLIMAWLWIFFVLASIIGRLPGSTHTRLFLRFALPPVIGLALVLLGVGSVTIGPFEGEFFLPSLDGIWESRPLVMRTYGPVMLVGLVSAIGLMAWEARRGRDGD